VRGLAFAPDGKSLVSGSWDKTVRVWNVADGSQRACLHGHQDEVLDVTVSPDGRHIVSGSSDRTIRSWDMAIGTEIARLRGHDKRVQCVAVSPDGRRGGTVSVADPVARAGDGDRIGP
jgi:WD40 repeat protein